MTTTKYLDGDGNEIPNPQNEEKFFKANLEFTRYKQDCRKRALDLASQNIDKEREYTKRFQDDPPLTIQTLADKYYNWLISIP